MFSLMALTERAASEIKNRKKISPNLRQVIQEEWANISMEMCRNLVGSMNRRLYYQILNNEFKIYFASVILSILTSMTIFFI